MSQHVRISKKGREVLNDPEFSAALVSTIISNADNLHTGKTIEFMPGRWVKIIKKTWR